MSWLTKGFYLRGGGVEVKKIGPGKAVLRVVLAVLLLYLLMAAGLLFFKNRLVLYPSRDIESNIGRIGWEFEDVWLEGTGGNKFNCWYLPAPEGAPTALLLHGNSGNLELMIGRIIMWHKLGYGLLGVDYEGFGRSEGRATLEAAVADAEAAFDFLVARGVPPERILIHGFSLGGGVAAQLAWVKRAHHGPVVLEGTFTSLLDTGRIKFPFLRPMLPLVLGGAYDTLATLKKISPSFILFLHSPDDEIVPFELGLKNFETYDGGPKAFVTLEGAHMDFMSNQGTYSRSLEAVFGRGGGTKNWPFYSRSDDGGGGDDAPEPPADPPPGPSADPRDSGGEPAPAAGGVAGTGTGAAAD
ncbi:MAG: alpha/beta hydrolase [Deltaproteobacteria bacterium]|jgi:fermentation-respiration switch protein FrsA (DUF1100 family)|nr:alpha/beta hydrolase [Deltaproteobacteria bacterium]